MKFKNKKKSRVKLYIALLVLTFIAYISLIRSDHRKKPSPSQLELIKKQKFKSRPKVSGFTIVELLIVVAIVGFLAFMSIAKYESFVERAKNSRRIAELSSMKRLLDTFYLNNGYYPTSNQPGSSDINWLNSNPANQDIQSPSPYYPANQYIPGFEDLPRDVNENMDFSEYFGWKPGYMYQSNGLSYKLMSHDASLYYDGPWVDAMRSGREVPPECVGNPSIAGPDFPWAISVSSTEAYCW